MSCGPRIPGGPFPSPAVAALSSRLRRPTPPPIMYRLLITRNELLTSIFPPGILDPVVPRTCVIRVCTGANVRTFNGAAAAVFPRDLCGNVVVGGGGSYRGLSST